MTRTSRLPTIGFVVTLELAAIGPTASADQANPPTIVVRVRDTAQVPDEVLTGAQTEVTRIYSQAGVKTVWLALGSSSGSTERFREPRVTVAILSRAQTERLSPVNTVDEVGIAVTDAQVAYVFYDRVESLTGGNGVDRAHMLGIALAHEIGHLLLPYKSHAGIGLMRAYWTSRDLQHTQRHGLFFTAEQVELIRARVTQLAIGSASTISW